MTSRTASLRIEREARKLSVRVSRAIRIGAPAFFLLLGLDLDIRATLHPEADLGRFMAPELFLGKNADPNERPANGRVIPGELAVLSRPVWTDAEARAWWANVGTLDDTDPRGAAPKLWLGRTGHALSRPGRPRRAVPAARLTLGAEKPELPCEPLVQATALQRMPHLKA